MSVVILTAADETVKRQAVFAFNVEGGEGESCAVEYGDALTLHIGGEVIGGVNRFGVCCAAPMPYIKTPVGQRSDAVLSALREHTLFDAVSAVKASGADGVFVIASSEGGMLIERAGGEIAEMPCADFIVTAGELLDKNLNQKYGDGRAARKRDTEMTRFCALESLFNDQNGDPKPSFTDFLGVERKRETPRGITVESGFSALRVHSEHGGVCLHKKKRSTKGGLVVRLSDGAVFLQRGTPACRSIFVPLSLMGEIALSDCNAAEQLQRGLNSEEYEQRREELERELLERPTGDDMSAYNKENLAAADEFFKSVRGAV